MNLTINGQQTAASYAPVTAWFAPAEPIGKLNTNSTPVQGSAALPGNSDDSLAIAAYISMDDFLFTIRTRLQEKNDPTGKTKNIEPLVSAFASAMTQLEEAYGKPVADMAMTAIAQGKELMDSHAKTLREYDIKFDELRKQAFEEFRTS
jgi:hypothetical protein